MVKIRRAQNKDVEKILLLLSEVLELHVKIRPDIFISGTTKYTRDDLERIFSNNDTPVFVAVNDSDEVVGYAFCVIQHQAGMSNMKNMKTLYIDDLCVDQKARHQQIGKSLYEWVIEYARNQGCYNVTLNVWEGNSQARAFYEKMGMFVRKSNMEVILKDE